MRTTAIAGLAGAALLTLSACSLGSLAPSPAPTGAGTASGDCIIGDWQLDTDDLVNQVETLLSVTTSVDDIDVQGDQDLTFAEDGTLSMRADLDATAQVDGRTLTRALHATGTGTWEWVDEGTSLKVTDWAWESDPSSEPGDEAELPTFDFADSPEVGVTCSDDALTLEPEGAPVTGQFSR